jgi:hypothetical protein
MNKHICKNCKYWKRRTLYKYSMQSNIGETWVEWDDEPVSYFHKDSPNKYSYTPTIIESRFGRCSCDKIIYTMGGGCVEDDDVEHENQPDSFLYSDGEAYGAYHYTGESFGCIHFIGKNK